jgi:hypothetical protein
MDESTASMHLLMSNLQKNEADRALEPTD